MLRKKIGSNGFIRKYKVRLVAIGHSQVEGVNYSEIFSPIAKVVAIKFLLSIVASYDIEVDEINVKTTFLHGVLEEDIYMI